MAPNRRLLTLLLSAFAVSAVALAGKPQPSASSSVPPLVNWSAPATYTPPGSGRIRTLSDISNPVPFIETTPCRQYNSFSLSMPLLQGVNRPVTLTGAPCGIPPSAVAVSVNITVFHITGAAGNGVFKVDTVSPPAVAWINYPSTETQRGNAGTVALDPSGQIVVQVAQGGGSVDFTVDTNGYYSSAPGTSTNVFSLTNNSNQRTIQATNLSITCSGPCGVEGITHSGDAVSGFAEGGSGANHGVFGTEFSISFGAAGVYGVDWTGDPGGTYYPAGVVGATKNYYGVLGKAPDFGYAVLGVSLDTSGNEQASGYLGYSNTHGVYFINGLAGTGTKSFIEPHPTDATKLIQYVSIEGREAGVYFRGRGQAHKGLATIDVPEDFRMVASEEGLSIQVTPIGEMANVAVTQIDLSRIAIKTSRDVEFFYTVNGVRKAYPVWNPIKENRKEFVPASPDHKLPRYLSANETQRLIDNGTYNADGTVNLTTAERAGWSAMWADRKAAEAAAAAAAAKNAAARSALAKESQQKKE